MSRLANQIKLGYFPTPPSLIDSIAAFLQAPDAHFRWLDVCAGEGVALSMLAERLGGETFGVELDTGRAAGAATRLAHVLSGSYEDMRLPQNPGGASVNLLNPPYGTDNDEGNRRLELSFLLLIYSLCTPYTQC
jgi:predicted RNA methylase